MRHPPFTSQKSANLEYWLYQCPGLQTPSHQLHEEVLHMGLVAHATVVALDHKIEFPACQVESRLRTCSKDTPKKPPKVHLQGGYMIFQTNAVTRKELDMIERVSQLFSLERAWSGNWRKEQKILQPFFGSCPIHCQAQFHFHKALGTSSHLHY